MLYPLSFNAQVHGCVDESLKFLLLCPSLHLEAHNEGYGCVDLLVLQENPGVLSSGTDLVKDGQRLLAIRNFCLETKINCNFYLKKKQYYIEHVIVGHEVVVILVEEDDPFHCFQYQLRIRS